MKNLTLFILIACTIQSTFTMEKNTTAEEALLSALIKFHHVTFQEKEVLGSALQVAQKVFIQKVTNLSGAKTDQAKAVAMREIIHMNETLRTLNKYKDEADRHEAGRMRQMREWDIRMADEKRRYEESKLYWQDYNTRQQNEETTMNAIRHLIATRNIKQLASVLQKNSLSSQSTEMLVQYATTFESYDIVQMLCEKAHSEENKQSGLSGLSSSSCEIIDINNSNN